MPIIYAVVVAAGCGKRAGVAKQFLPFRGRPLYWHSVATLACVPHITGIVLVLPEERLDEEEQSLARHKELLGVPLIVCAGGPQRQDSVALGLAKLPPEVSHVVVHDAARPFVSASLVTSVCAALANGETAVIPVLPISDTVKMVENGHVLKTLDRSKLGLVQTPQGFSVDLLRQAHVHNTASVTDDAALVESLGGRVCTVPGESANVKITHPEDIRLLQDAPRPVLSVGQGYDVHRFGGTRPLILGGVCIPGAPKVDAHSDGDVLLHALMDALLGAASLGDIGQHFPDNDPNYLGISSSVLLDRVLELLREQNMRPLNADLTVIAQKPKISPYREEIRNNLARLLCLDRQYVNVKATTEEHLGFTGRLEGIKASAIVLCQTDRQENDLW